MNIVFLVHYFPPLNSTGARRILAFSKYLHRLGHNIHIISTVKTHSDGLLSEKVPDYCNLIELSWLKKNNKQKVDESKVPTVGNRSLMGIVLIKIKRFIMKYLGQIVDHRLLFAMQFINPFLADSAKKAITEADIVISSCPPWPVHLAGAFCALRFKKKWLADYRDQFSGNHVFIGNKFTQYLEVVIERWLLKAASGAVVISEPMREYYLKFTKNVFCIENGYDEEQFAEAEQSLSEDKIENKKYIRYMGTITPYRVPEIFFAALLQIKKELRENIIVEFYGESAPAQEVLQTKYHELVDNVKFFGVVSHKKSVAAMLTTDALLFQETTSFASSDSHSSRGAISAKLFEYLAAKKPIIAEVEPANLMGQAIHESGLCCICTLDQQKMYEGLMQWITEPAEYVPNVDYIKQFSRKTKTVVLEKAIYQTLEIDPIKTQTCIENDIP